MALWLCRLYIDVDPDSPEQMLGYQHNGFSVDAGVCIQAHDRAGLERLLRYCARPPFALERLRKEGNVWRHRRNRPRCRPR